MKRGSSLLTALLTMMVALALAGCSSFPSLSFNARPARGSAVANSSPTPQIHAAWASVTVPQHSLALRFAPSDQQTAYLCVDDGPAMAPLQATPRLYKSVDGANTWNVAPQTPVFQPVASQIPTLATCAIFVDAHDAQDVFLQAGQLAPEGAGHDIAHALYRSRDGGATWTTLTELDGTDGFTDLAVFGSRLVAHPHFSVFGYSPCSPSTAPTPHPSSLIYASDDGGQTWHTIGLGIEAAGYSAEDMSPAGNTLFVRAWQVSSAACAESPGWALWRSDDAGVTWTRTSLAAQALAPVNFTARASGSGYNGVAVEEQNAGMLQLVYSLDSGDSWKVIPAPLTANNAPFTSVAITSSGHALVVGYDSQIVLLCNPSEPTPTFESYTSDLHGDWQAQRTANGSRLWAFSPYTMGTEVATLAYLPLP